MLTASKLCRLKVTPITKKGREILPCLAKNLKLPPQAFAEAYRNSRASA